METWLWWLCIGQWLTLLVLVLVGIDVAGIRRKLEERKDEDPPKETDA